MPAEMTADMLQLAEPDARVGINPQHLDPSEGVARWAGSVRL